MGLANQRFGSHKLLGTSIGRIGVIVAEDGGAMILKAGDETGSGERIRDNKDVKELLREVIKFDGAEANGPIRSMKGRRRGRRKKMRRIRVVLMRWRG
jgi:hypothetical protein